MRLADLDRVTELAGELRRLDAFAGPATLALGDMTLALAADETADFVKWKRAQIRKEMRRLGVDNEMTEGPSKKTTRKRPVLQAKNAARAKRAAITDTAPAMSLDEALAEARRRILGAFEQDLRADVGETVDEKDIARDLEFMAEKRRDDIRQLAAELMRPKRVKTCSNCHAPATTVIAGADYCKQHAEAARRPVLPDNVVTLIPSAA